MVNSLQVLALAVIESVLGNPTGQIMGYIDPHTTQQVFTLLGPLVALFTTVATLIVTAALFFRCRLLTWFREASCLKLLIFLVVAFGVIAGVLAVYELVLYLQASG
jgi:hypothetical protein